MTFGGVFRASRTFRLVSTLVLLTTQLLVLGAFEQTVHALALTPTPSVQQAVLSQQSASYTDTNDLLWFATAGNRWTLLGAMNFAVSGTTGTGSQTCANSIDTVQDGISWKGMAGYNGANGWTFTLPKTWKGQSVVMAPYYRNSGVLFSGWGCRDISGQLGTNATYPGRRTATNGSVYPFMWADTLGGLAQNGLFTWEHEFTNLDPGTTYKFQYLTVLAGNFCSLEDITTSGTSNGVSYSTKDLAVTNNAAKTKGSQLVASTVSGVTQYKIVRKGSGVGCNHMALSAIQVHASDAVPQISSFSVTSGSRSGGTSTTINGNNLSDINSVTIGGSAAIIESTSESTVDIVTPAGSVGAADVVIGNGTDTTTMTGGYTYTNQSAPSIQLALPNDVTSTPYGTTVRITAQASTAGSVTFKSGGNAIVSCSNIATVALSATCDWTPSSANAATRLTADFVPTDQVAYHNLNAVGGRNINVTKVAAVVSASSPTVTYGDSVPVITPSISGLVNGDVPAVVTGLTCTTDYTTSSAVGSLPATSCSGGSASNYDLTYSPGAVVVSANEYRVDFNAGLGTVNPTFAMPQVATSTLLPTPNRANYAFDGWYSAAVGGTLVGLGGALFTPTSDTTLYARWTQSSLVGLSNPIAFGSITAFPGNDGGITATRSETKVIVDYFADTLPEGTVITAYLQGNKTHAINVIGGNPNVLLSVVVAWKAIDETVPDIDPSDSPIRVTIINGNIKAGATVYAIKDGVPTAVGTATMDGRATANIYQDPEIAIVNASVATPTGSVNFDGESALSYPSSNDFSLTGDYTVEFWAKYAVNPRNGSVWISRWNNSAQEYSLEVSGGTMTWNHKSSNGDNKLYFTRPTANAWHHYAIVRSGNSLTAYVDGVIEGTATYSGSVVSGQTSNLEVGGRSLANNGWYSTFFQGRMSNVRMSKEAIYTSAFTPSTSALDGVATTSLLLNTSNDANFAVDSAMNATPTLVGSPTSSPDVPFALSVPEPPSQVRGTSWVGTTTTISWNASADVAGQGSNTYTVYKSEDGMNFSTVSGCIAVSGTSCTGTGFTLARGYIFKATATNDAGSSDYSIVEVGEAAMYTGDWSYCAEINVYGSQACGVMGSRQPYTTAIMPTPIYCDQVDGHGIFWSDDDGSYTDRLGVFDADGNMYFVHKNEIRKITPAGFATSPSCTSTLFNASPLLKSPSGTSIGMDATGNIYVSNADAVDKSVIKISADGSTANIYLTTAQTGVTLESIKFDSDQNLLGYNNPMQSIANLIRFSNTNPPVKKVLLAMSNPTFGVLGGNKVITGFSLNAFDDVLISLNSGDEDYLIKIDAAFDQGTKPDFCPYDCPSSYYEQLAQWDVYDASGNFYASNFPNTFHVFAKFAAYTWSTEPFVDSEGNIWVGQRLLQHVLKLSPEGKPLLSTATPFGFAGGSSHTTYTRIDPNGTMWVQIENGSNAWIKFVGATKPFLRQLTYKGIGSTPYGTAKAGQIQLDGATGSVAFKTTNSGNVSVSNIGALSAANNLEPGKYVVSGTALDSSNTAGTWTYTLTVTKAQPTVGLTSTLNPSTFENSVTFTATPSVFDAGTTVSFYDGATLLGTCIVTIVSCAYTTSALSTGSHTITASIAESVHYLTATSSAVTQLVSTIGTTTTWTNSALPTEGETITLTANVAPTAATGTVVFKDANNNTLCTTSTLLSGAASCVWSGNPVLGTYSVTANYVGDANYAASNSSAANVTITAVYTVTFSGASGISPVTYRTGSPSFTLATPSIAHQRFLGWFDSAIGGNLVSQGGVQYTPTATNTLHAHWLDTFTVTYNLASGTSTLPTQDEVGTGETFIVTAAPTRPNYLFNGWSRNGDNQLYMPSSTFTMGTNNVTLTANWLSLVHPISRTTFNNAPGSSWLWAYAGSGVHAGVDIQPGWCVTAGTNSVPADWVVTAVTSDSTSNSFQVGGGYTFSGGGYNFSPDPSITISTGATQTIGLGSSITPTAISNTACTANNYVVEPTLPDGLLLNPQTGVISGQPTAARASTPYTVTAQRIVNNDGTLNVAGTLIGYSSATFTLNVIAPPEASTNVIATPGDSQLSVAFTPGSDSGTAITKYQYSTDGGTTWRDKATTESPFVISTTSDVDAALVNGTSYNVQIRAFNAFAGVASNTVVATPDIAPLAPTNIVVTPGNKQLSVAFNAAVNTGSAIVKYQYSTDNGSSWVDAPSATSPIAIATMSGGAQSNLVNDVTYQVRLRAVNTLSGAGSVVADAAPVKSPQAPLSWNLASTSVAYLETLTLDVVGGSGTGDVEYNVSQSSTCSVAGDVLTLGAVGSTCEVTATKNTDDTYLVTSTTSQIITVTRIDQSSVLTLVNASTMTFGETLSLLAIGGSGDGLITYYVSNAGTTGCLIVGDVLSVTAAGNCEILASRGQSMNYNATPLGSQPTMTVVVSTASQSLQFTSSIPALPLAGGTYDVTVQSSRGLTPSISIVSGSCTITGTTVSFGASGNCVVEATQLGNGQYSAAPAITQTIVVGSRNQTLSFSDATLAIGQKTFGDPSFIVDATSSEPTATVQYSLGGQTSNGACSVTSFGLVIVNRVGVCEIVATSPATSSFIAASPISHLVEIVPAIPQAPFVLATSAGNRSITVSYSPPANDGGSGISGYQLVAEDQTSGSSSIVVETGCSVALSNQQGTCTIRGLENGVMYRIRIAAINQAGIGVYSQLSIELTAATNPAAVQQLTVSEDNGALLISWQDPDSLGGGVFSEYRIFVKRSSDVSYDPLHYFAITNSSILSLLITQESPSDNNSFAGGPLLVNGVAYDVKVITVTLANSLELAGNTAVVNKIPRTVPDAPRSPSATAYGSNLVIRWLSPTSDGGMAIVSYSVTFDGVPCVVNQATDTYCTVATPIEPGDYVIAIAAINGVGESLTSRGVFSIAALPVATTVETTTPSTSLPPVADDQLVSQLPATGSRPMPFRGVTFLLTIGCVLLAVKRRIRLL